MKKFLLSTVAIAMLSTAASAADLDMAPAPEAMPMYDWTGFYIGASVGWLGGKTKSRYAYEIDDLPVDPFISEWRRSNKPDGGIFGGYAGYNWQTESGLVLGIEGDIYGANAKDRKRTTIDTDFVDVELRGKEKIKSTWAIRGRLGWAIENFMPYIAGGFAGASMKTSVGGDLYTTDIDPVLISSDSTSKTKSYTGWTMGAGAEWMITPNWLLRGDYQYKDLGTKTNLSRSGVGTIPAGDFDYDISNRTKLKSHQFTFGAAFKF